MKYGAQVRMGSREKQTFKESTVTLQANRKIKSLDYAKLDNPLYVGQQDEQRQMAAEHDPIKDDSLVKHMRNLPGYLQSARKGENIQGQALNFGVLDWGRLENWKSNEKRIPPRYNMKTSLSGTNPTLVENRAVRISKSKKNIPLPNKNQQASSNVSSLNSSSRKRLPPGVRWPRGKPEKPQISESSPCLNDMPAGDKSLHEIDCIEGKQVDQMTSEKKTSSSDKSQPTKMTSANDDINHDIDTWPVTPKDISITSSSDDINHSFEVNERRLSECFSPTEFSSLKPFSDVPHSCPFPFPLTQSEPECLNESVTQVKGKSLKEKHSTSSLSKLSDLQKNEPPVLKGRISSPNRRFSFSLGKMARSFSFKESSSTSQQSFDASKDNPTNPSRSSPLRRFLDPLLKLKGSHSTEKVQQPKLELSPTNFAHLSETELLHRKKHISFNVPALLQLTMKNGIPFFKLVVESSSDILAAAVKKLPSAKDDSSLIYAFYSVHETKKKSGGWMYHGSKDKSYDFGYNIVGQMKISSSYHPEFSGVDKDLYVVRESVLYSSNTMLEDQKTLDCKLDGELAAIIIKNPSDQTCGDIGSSKSTLVVLPEGVHNWPNGGVRSALMNRWKNGACDCGGWDIGCQFRVLSHESEMVKNSTSSTLCTTSSSLDLCYKVGDKNKFSFRLVSLEDGLYSLDYDPSMSLLQAFSVCVAVVSSQKLTHMFQVNYSTLSKDSSETVLTGDKVRSREEYFSKPPASPVGRV
ncbi:uncharacterized protein [Rutidosis leptorrhynchoides]|uniref:uncharacterized protein n=1 Tax=Rutidosis leptorrhynchoides TaxID=125765 RepID=UPI003A999B2F